MCNKSAVIIASHTELIKAGHYNCIAKCMHHETGNVYAREIQYVNMNKITHTVRVLLIPLPVPHEDIWIKYEQKRWERRSKPSRLVSVLYMEIRSTEFKMCGGRKEKAAYKESMSMNHSERIYIQWVNTGLCKQYCEDYSPAFAVVNTRVIPNSSLSIFPSPYLRGGFGRMSEEWGFACPHRDWWGNGRPEFVRFTV